MACVSYSDILAPLLSNSAGEEEVPRSPSLGPRSCEARRRSQVSFPPFASFVSHRTSFLYSTLQYSSCTHSSSPIPPLRPLQLGQTHSAAAAAAVPSSMASRTKRLAREVTDCQKDSVRSLFFLLLLLSL